MTAVMINQWIAFLGPIGGPELIMVLLVLVFLAVPIVVIVIALRYFSSRKTGSPSMSGRVQTRLADLENLKSQNLISEEEYAEKRRQIINDL